MMLSSSLSSLTLFLGGSSPPHVLRLCSLWLSTCAPHLSLLCSDCSPPAPPPEFFPFFRCGAYHINAGDPGAGDAGWPCAESEMDYPSQGLCYPEFPHLKVLMVGFLCETRDGGTGSGGWGLPGTLKGP